MLFGPLYQLLTRRAAESKYHDLHDSSKDAKLQLTEVNDKTLASAHDGTSFSTHSSYTVFLQHNMSLSQRVSASMSSDISMTTKERLVYERSGIMEPGEMAYRNNSGNWLFREMFKVLVIQNDGFLIFLNITGSTVFDGNETNAEDEQWWNMFQKNGVIIDVSGDLFGWNEENDDQDGDNEKIDDYSSSVDHGSKVRRVKCTAKKLSNVIETVFREASNLAKKQRDERQSHATTNSRSFSTTTNRSAIPIVIDSLAPFFAFFGERCTLSFLRSLQQQQHCRTEISNNDNDNKQSSSSTMVTQVSPLVISSMKGSGNLSQHRTLEELSDAIVMLMQGEISILRRSRMTGKVSVEKQPIIEDEHVTTPNRVANNNNSSTGHSSSDGQVTTTQAAMATSMDFKTLSQGTMSAASCTTTGNYRKGKIVLAVEEDVRQKPQTILDSTSKSVEQQPPKPNIFMEEGDPEFDDLDEEDPDDDLDI